MQVIEISTREAEYYYKISKAQLLRIVEMKKPIEADDFIRKNCKFAKISSTEDVYLGFANNCEAWEWKEFCKEVKDDLK